MVVIVKQLFEEVDFWSLGRQMHTRVEVSYTCDRR